jgi:hypothetical protein
MSIAYELETSTSFVEHSENYYFSNSFERQFTAEYFPLKRQLYISMGAADVTRDQLAGLRQKLSQTFNLIEETISSDDHTVNLMFPILSKDFSSIDKILESMATWAAGHNLLDGCFLCGSKNDIAFREVGDLKTIMCLKCHQDIEEKFVEHTETLANQTIQARYGMKEEKLRSAKGIIIASIVAPFLALVWALLASILPFPFIFVPFLTSLYLNTLYEICKRIVHGFNLVCMVILTIVGFLSQLVLIIAGCLNAGPLYSMYIFSTILYLLLGYVIGIIARRKIET